MGLSGLTCNCRTEQQITLYPHRDDNNAWTVLNNTVDATFDPLVGTPVRHITDGQLIRLDHPITKKKLHSHDIRPSVSEVDWQNEVSAYGFDGFDGDANDYWAVEIQKDYCDSGDSKAKKRLRAIRTKFRLRHMMTGCYLFSHKVKLPDWGFEQQEVTCNKVGFLCCLSCLAKEYLAEPDYSKQYLVCRDKHAPDTYVGLLLYVDHAEHTVVAHQEKAEKINYQRPGFFRKFGGQC